ncbi:MAG: pilus assembly protein CpaB [Clostridia bacterium]|nr:pilus assembly protein CpaB [Clostridia bacterium]
MKNRTIIGIICMVLAVAITFLISPVVNNLTSDTTRVIRLAKDVKQGSPITDEDIEVVKVKTDTKPKGIIVKKNEVIGKYAASNLFAGDYFTKAKLSGEANTADDVFASLDGSKIAVSVTIDTFAAGLSGKLQNGDIISLIVTPKGETESVIPAELKYVKVVTTTTSGGIDNDSVVKNEDGSYELPSTITVLVNEKQAKLLALYEKNADMQVALVYRGDKKTANKFLAKQNEYFGGKANE